jgi:hypothetical protein
MNHFRVAIGTRTKVCSVTQAMNFIEASIACRLLRRGVPSRVVVHVVLDDRDARQVASLPGGFCPYDGLGSSISIPTLTTTNATPIASVSAEKAPPKNFEPADGPAAHITVAPQYASFVNHLIAMLGAALRGLAAVAGMKGHLFVTGNVEECSGKAK